MVVKLCFLYYIYSKEQKETTKYSDLYIDCVIARSAATRQSVFLPQIAAPVCALVRNDKIESPSEM